MGWEMNGRDTSIDSERHTRATMKVIVCILTVLLFGGGCASNPPHVVVSARKNGEWVLFKEFIRPSEVIAVLTKNKFPKTTSVPLLYSPYGLTHETGAAPSLSEDTNSMVSVTYDETVPQEEMRKMMESLTKAVLTVILLIWRIIASINQTVI